MKITRSEAATRRVDNAVEIVEIFDGRDFSFDFVIGRINGVHPLVVNSVSDRAYFVLSGALDVTVGDRVHQAAEQDLILVPKGVRHGIRGQGEYVVVTSPPFDPANERVADARD